MVESSMPATAAVVAASMRKLWPAYCCWGNPMVARMVRIWAMNHGFVTGSPDGSIKKGPGRSPREVVYSIMAVTGHRLSPVRPTTMSDPAPNWSHFGGSAPCLGSVGCRQPRRPMRDEWSY